MATDEWQREDSPGFSKPLSMHHSGDESMKMMAAEYHQRPCLAWVS